MNSFSAPSFPGFKCNDSKDKRIMDNDTSSKPLGPEHFNNRVDGRTEHKNHRNPDIETNGFYCSYCKLTFALEEELKAHCSTESHQLAITTDHDKKWHFRAPPRGLNRKQVALCEEISGKGTCRLGNQCLGAHCQEEFQEWTERIAYREWKMDQARQEDLNGSSYAEQLLERWMKASRPEQIMAEDVEGFKVEVMPKLFATFSVKNSSYSWTFIISAKLPLRLLSLLYDTHRKYFQVLSISQRKGEGPVEKPLPSGNGCQEWHNQQHAASAIAAQEGAVFSYAIKVKFEADIFGTFRQTLALDFGQDPVVVQKLCVDVVPPADLAQLQEIRETVLCSTERWNSSNTLCVPYEKKAHTYTEHDLRLFYYYPIPHQGNFVMTQAVANPIPSESTYKARFHELLYIEEIAQYNLISRYNVSSKLQMIDCYILTPGTASVVKYAQGGELYACMKLSSEVSEDSPAGRMIQAYCSSVFFAPMSAANKRERNTKPKVYEATIEDKGKKMIYLRISKQCVTELNLKVEREYVAEVQFQMNRLPFCEMHYAVDSLSPTCLLFPDVSLPMEIPSSPSKPWDASLDSHLNPKQKEAILAITAPRGLQLPPILIIGPFGTGKTFTLAQAVKQILSEPDSKVLVCTHSNSAADIYIREYLHPFVESGHPEATPIRVYYQHRWVATVNQTVLQYCLITEENACVSFRVPTVQDLEKPRVIVTTLSSSRYLVNLQLKKGFFTHILIDEAAQAMECEAIMPLALADANTRIALAGDHMQLSPEVYSPFTQEKNLQLSLLERLFDVYPSGYPCKILLCENYRSHKAIVQYTSDMFYENSLLASKDQPPHKTFFPITFFTARGEDIQDTNSTAYYNNSEVYEVAERVVEIHKSWPKTWGPFNDSSIGVVTPYYDQVVRIRTELRKRKLPNVSVERVLNVQGKQFRAIILSTVRTLQTCRNDKNSGDELDFGFLSNARLLNTAITRGQSLVAVVGDPISLCSMGKCRKLWEKFIRICYENGSLYGITWQSLQAQLDGLELKKTYMLNPLAPEFIPRRFRMGMPLVSMPGNGLVGNSPYFNSPLVPPCYPLPSVHQENMPFYPVGPFSDPMSYSYMSLPFSSPFVPYTYGPPSYGYPWWFPSKSGSGANGNNMLQTPAINNREQPQQQHVVRKMPEFDSSSRALAPAFQNHLEHRHNHLLPALEDGNVPFEDAVAQSRLSRHFPEQFRPERSKFEMSEMPNIQTRIDRNQNLDTSRLIPANIFDMIPRRNSYENLANSGPGPHPVPQLNHMVPDMEKHRMNFAKPNIVERYINQEEPRRPAYAENMNTRENSMVKALGFYEGGGNPLFNRVQANVINRPVLEPNLEQMSSGYHRRNSLPSNQALTVEQLENSFMTGADIRFSQPLDRTRHCVKLQEEKSMNGRIINLSDRLAQTSLDKQVNGMTNGVGYQQMVPNHDYMANTANNRISQNEEKFALEKLLQVSQRVWSEQPQQQQQQQQTQQQQSFQPSQTSSLFKALSENELFESRHPLLTQSYAHCLPTSDFAPTPHPDSFVLGNSVHTPKKVLLDGMGPVAYANCMPNATFSGYSSNNPGGEGGYNVFQHKTIFNERLKNKPTLYGNTF